MNAKLTKDTKAIVIHAMRHAEINGNLFTSVKVFLYEGYGKERRFTIRYHYCYGSQHVTDVAVALGLEHEDALRDFCAKHDIALHTILEYASKQEAEEWGHD